ncbi:TVP38/TMEM64 family protein [Tropicibacter sp. Alg240-R139]|uniref:TVP38/TMEM64 family protein n=1 Tax=Tropicibacter sp. Alg240-R139 TaxID=2305991 RepID=UPI0013E0DB9A|nr:TVP38/TMEM64 family protein [Tropicibacter sp. Alg240-R139]
MSTILRAYGMWAPVVVIALMVVHSFVPFPAELLALCAGAVFGTLMGSVVIWGGAMLGGVLAFYLARALGQEVVQGWISDRQNIALERWTKDQGTITLLVCRLIPVISFNLINYAAGLTRVRVWTFLWTTGLGILPVTVLSTYLGAQMKTLDWPMLLIVSAVAVGLVVLCHTQAKKHGWI